MGNEDRADMAPTTQRELTFGEKAVGLSFNHGEGEIFEKIDRVKILFADIIDLINPVDYSPDLKPAPSYMANNLKGMATRACIMAQMAVVKFITWKD